MSFLPLLLFLVDAVSARPTLFKATGEVVKDEYFVALHSNLGPRDLVFHLKELQEAFNLESPKSKFEPYLNLAKFGFPSYSVSALSADGLKRLLQHDQVRFIEPVGFANASSNQPLCSQNPTSSSSVQNNAAWGLARTTTRSKLDENKNNWKYYYNSDKLGEGVNAYVLDTGIYCGHNDFTSKAKGTCTCGYVAPNVEGIGSCTSEKGGYSDGNGHGTHVASTIAGQVYGIAKAANVVAVKVLNKDGLGSWSGVMNGVNWVSGKGGPAVACLSLGGLYSNSVNEGINALVRSGTQAFIASGNNFADACAYSPASASLPVVVGATTNKDQRASYSNYGSCVDIMAPGNQIDAASIKSSTAVEAMSGTSMAAPHVAGVACKMLSMDPSMSGSQVKQALLDSATQGVCSNLYGSPDLLLYGLC